MASGSDRRVDVSVVIPCLNEEAGVGSVVEAAWRGIESSGRTGEVIVVDNGSTDLLGRDRRGSTGRESSFEPRPGYGSAYLAGFAEARGDLIVMADADGTYDVGDLAPFLDAFDHGADLVLGSALRAARSIRRSHASVTPLDREPDPRPGR